MKRREFVAGLGSMTAWPLAARAQQAAVPVIGWLHGGTMEAARDTISAFHQGLRSAMSRAGLSRRYLSATCWRNSRRPSTLFSTKGRLGGPFSLGIAYEVDVLLCQPRPPNALLATRLHVARHLL
jgi:hypothetical protein